jgi:hypothetical protein
VVVILFVKNEIPLSFLLVASSSTTTSSSTASAAAPLTLLQGDLIGFCFGWGVALRIAVFLNRFSL